MVICVVEDRKSHEASLKLLLLSLTRHCPDVSIALFYRLADNRFKTWLSRCPQVSLQTNDLDGPRSFNVKPQALMTLLKSGHDEILWMDSDIIVTRDFRYLLRDLTPRTIVVTEEAAVDGADDPDGLRARLWGLDVGRSFQTVANSAVIRVTHEHIPLLETWRTYLQKEVYQEAQRQVRRPRHLVGDQDVLTALLTSRNFADIPVRFLREGTDIIQFFELAGYVTRDRISHLIQGMAPLIHMQGYQKPWIWFNESRKRESFKDYLVDLYVDLSPHTMAALTYRDELDDPSPWMDPHFSLSTALRMAGFWHPCLVGLPITALVEISRKFRRTSPRTE